MADVLARVTLTGTCVNRSCTQVGKIQRIRYRRNAAGALVARRETCRACGRLLR